MPVQECTLTCEQCLVFSYFREQRERRSQAKRLGAGIAATVAALTPRREAKARNGGGTGNGGTASADPTSGYASDPISVGADVITGVDADVITGEDTEDNGFNFIS